MEQWHCAWVFANHVTANYLCFHSVHESLLSIAADCLQYFLSNYLLQTGQFAGQLLLLLDKFLSGHRLKFIEN